MGLAVGVLAAERIAIGVVDQFKVVDRIRQYPGSASMAVHEMPVERIVQILTREIAAAAKDKPINAIGIGFPGIIHRGIVEESPNLPQVKGTDFEGALSSALSVRLGPVALSISNDADATAAGIAASIDHLDRMIRVWTLGTGIGFGRYPVVEGVWEGGHTTVTLDSKENYCGCGGLGHLEGIMGTRAIRLRFLDMEPEDVFAGARLGDHRCTEFVTLWHRALAAATATAIHLDGPGEFFITGPNARYLDIEALDRYVSAMVTMSPLQANTFRIVHADEELGGDWRGGECTCGTQAAPFE